MSRKYIDCREYPSESHCSVAMSADNAQELLQAAVQHAVSVHGHEDTPVLRSELLQLFKDGTPPLELPMMQHLEQDASQNGRQASAQP